MQASKINCNPQVLSVLSRYPQWQEMILESIDKPLLDKNYCPEFVEVFDQHGLLAGKVRGCISYECIRTHQEVSEFTAWLFDGELTVFYVGSEIVINRLQVLVLALGGLL
jgi:hypothetical protein